MIGVISQRESQARSSMENRCGRKRGGLRDDWGPVLKAEIKSVEKCKLDGKTGRFARTLAFRARIWTSAKCTDYVVF